MTDSTFNVQQCIAYANDRRLFDHANRFAPANVKRLLTPLALGAAALAAPGAAFAHGGLAPASQLPGGSTA